MKLRRKFFAILGTRSSFLTCYFVLVRIAYSQPEMLVTGADAIGGRGMPSFSQPAFARGHVEDFTMTQAMTQRTQSVVSLRRKKMAHSLSSHRFSTKVTISSAPYCG
jgi:hypothetical protein